MLTLRIVQRYTPDESSVSDEFFSAIVDVVGPLIIVLDNCSFDFPSFCFLILDHHFVTRIKLFLFVFRPMLHDFRGLLPPFVQR